MLEDFAKVLEKARHSIDELETMAKAQDTVINEINTCNFKTMREFVFELSSISLKNKLDSNGNYYDTGITCLGNNAQRYVIRIARNGEVGISRLNKNICVFDKDLVNRESIWMRWMGLRYDNYKDFEYHNKPIIDIFNLFVENWDKFKSNVEQSFKEVATRDVANQIRKAEQDIIDRERKINNITCIEEY